MNDADIIQVRTYIRCPSLGFCRGRLLHDKIRRSSRPRSLRFCRKFADPPLSGFLIAFLFSLPEGGGTSRGKKEVEVHAEVDIDIWFRISGSNQIRSPIVGRRQRLRYNQNEFSTSLDSYDVITVASISCLEY